MRMAWRSWSPQAGAAFTCRHSSRLQARTSWPVSGLILNAAAVPAPLPVRRWQNAPDAAQPIAIEDGQRVAIKHCLKPNGGGKFGEIQSPWAFEQASKWALYGMAGWQGLGSRCPACWPCSNEVQDTREHWRATMPMKPPGPFSPTLRLPACLPPQLCAQWRMARSCSTASWTCCSACTTGAAASVWCARWRRRAGRASGSTTLSNASGASSR